MIYWEEKRPITVEILKRLSIRKTALMLGAEHDYSMFIEHEQLPVPC
jgi:hypothetical protein